MNILIRNVNESTLKSIDNKAKKAGMSRQEYLVQQLNRMAAVDAYREEREEYATLVKNMSVVIENNTEILEKAAELLQDYEDEGRN